MMTEDEYEQIWSDIETYLFSEGFEEYRILDEDYDRICIYPSDYGVGSSAYYGSDLQRLAVYSPVSKIYLIGEFSQDILDELDGMAEWQV